MSYCHYHVIVIIIILGASILFYNQLTSYTLLIVALKVKPIDERISAPKWQLADACPQGQTRFNTTSRFALPGHAFAFIHLLLCAFSSFLPLSLLSYKSFNLAQGVQNSFIAPLVWVGSCA